MRRNRRKRRDVRLFAGAQSPLPLCRVPKGLPDALTLTVRLPTCLRDY